MHFPATQVSPPPQASPQPPQWPLLVWVSTQAVPHMTVPAGQVVTHPRGLHSCSAPHTLPQAPQLARSVVMSTQTPPHRVWPVGQAHLPPPQTVPPTQAVPQAPQF